MKIIYSVDLSYFYSKGDGLLIITIQSESLEKSGKKWFDEFAQFYLELSLKKEIYGHSSGLSYPSIVVGNIINDPISGGLNVSKGDIFYNS